MWLLDVNILLYTHKEELPQHPTCAAWLEQVVAGERPFAVTDFVCRRAQATGNLVPDTYLAAVAIKHGGELASADRDFERFPGLRWHNPLA